MQSGTFIVALSKNFTVHRKIVDFSWGSLLLVVAVSLFSGCDNGKLGKPVTVTGKFQLNGEPLSNVQVQFFAIEALPAEYRTQLATTDSEGRYSINRVYPAKYLVSLTDTQSSTTPAGTDDVVVVNSKPSRLEQWSADRSQLNADVTAEQSKFDFDLSSQKSRSK